MFCLDLPAINPERKASSPRLPSKESSPSEAGAENDDEGYSSEDGLTAHLDNFVDLTHK